MPEPAKIRNVAVVGHRGTGKTSLVEALLFQSGAVNRLGTVEGGTTVSDADDDEHARQLSISMSLAHPELARAQAQREIGEVLASPSRACRSCTRRRSSA